MQIHKLFNTENTRACRGDWGYLAAENWWHAFLNTNVFRSKVNAKTAVISVQIYDWGRNSCYQSSEVWLRQKQLLSVFRSKVEAETAVISIQIYGWGRNSCYISDQIYGRGRNSCYQCSDPWLRQKQLLSVFRSMVEAETVVFSVQIYGWGRNSCYQCSDLWLRQNSCYQRSDLWLRQKQLLSVFRSMVEAETAVISVQIFGWGRNSFHPCSDTLKLSEGNTNMCLFRTVTFFFHSTMCLFSNIEYYFIVHCAF